jgi:uncharacterized protein with PIN domain
MTAWHPALARSGQSVQTRFAELQDVQRAASAERRPVRLTQLMTIRFLVDGMLVRLGKYLRCAGCDAVWDVSLPSRKAAARAQSEGRFFVTRNTRLDQEFKAPANTIAVASDDPVAQFAQLVEACGSGIVEHPFTRCIRCNVALDELADRAVIDERVPAAVRAVHKRYWRCPSCATVFWHGSHVANTCRKLGMAMPSGR